MHEGVETVHTLNEAVDAATRLEVKELYVIGGAEIYRSCFDRADRIYLTRIYRRYEGDAFFPSLDTSWKLCREHRVEENGTVPRHSFQVWEK